VMQSSAEAHEMPYSGSKWCRPAAVRLGLGTMVQVVGWPVTTGRAGPPLAVVAAAALDGAMIINPAKVRNAARARPRMVDVPSVRRGASLSGGANLPGGAR